MPHTSNIPFIPVLPVDVSLNLPCNGWIDDYIDDLVYVYLHLGENEARMTRVILLAISIFAISTHTQTTSTPHHYILAAKKCPPKGYKRNARQSWAMSLIQDSSQ